MADPSLVSYVNKEVNGGCIMDRSLDKVREYLVETNEILVRVAKGQ